MNTLLNMGDSIADTSTGTLIKVTNMGGHFHLYVMAGADRIAELSGNHPTAPSACRRASYLRTRLANGVTVQQLVAEHIANQQGVLATANAAVVVEGERSVDELIEQVNATLDVAAPQPLPVPQVDTRSAWAERQAARRQAARANTRSQAHLKPITAAEIAAIRAATTNPDGTLTVRTLPGQQWTVLRGLDRRIPGQATYRGSSRIITALTYRPEQVAGYLTEGIAA